MSFQDRLEKLQTQFESQEQHTSALRSTLDSLLRHFETLRTPHVPWSSKMGSIPVSDSISTQLGAEPAPVGVQPPSEPPSNPTGARSQTTPNSSRASQGLQQIAATVGKYKPEQPKKFNVESGQEATNLQIVTLKGQRKAFGMKQNWNEMEILATILTEGLAGKYYEWANNQEQFASTQFHSLHDFFQRLAKFHLAEEPLTKTLVDIQRAWQR
eukprot:scaffold141_cov378-Pavlova_lutheri.AAC.1